MNAQRKLYALSRGEGRPNTDTLYNAASQLGVSAALRRVDRGYSTRGLSQGKLRDDIWIEWNGQKYGAGWNDLGSHATCSLQQFAEDVVESLTDEQRRALEIDYYTHKLIDLGLGVQTWEL